MNKCIVEAAAVHFLSSLFRIEVSVDTNLHFTMKLFSYESALHLRRLSRDFRLTPSQYSLNVVMIRSFVQHVQSIMGKIDIYSFRFSAKVVQCIMDNIPIGFRSKNPASRPDYLY